MPLAFRKLTLSPRRGFNRLARPREQAAPSLREAVRFGRDPRTVAFLGNCYQATRVFFFPPRLIVGFIGVKGFFDL